MSKWFNHSFPKFYYAQLLKVRKRGTNVALHVNHCACEYLCTCLMVSPEVTFHSTGTTLQEIIFKQLVYCTIRLVTCHKECIMSSKNRVCFRSFGQFMPYMCMFQMLQNDLSRLYNFIVYLHVKINAWSHAYINSPPFSRKINPDKNWLRSNFPSLAQYLVR